jgi:hypothetical protein
MSHAEVWLMMGNPCFACKLFTELAVIIMASKINDALDTNELITWHNLQLPTWIISDDFTAFGTPFDAKRVQLAPTTRIIAPPHMLTHG